MAINKTGSPSQSFEEWKRDRADASSKWLQGRIAQLEPEMKQEAPWHWSYETGYQGAGHDEARNGLFIRTSGISGSHGYWTYDIEAGYSVDYGYWLELKTYEIARDMHHSSLQPGGTFAERVARAESALGGFGPQNPGAEGMAWGRDAIVLPTMALLMAEARSELARIWSEGNVFGYQPRFSPRGGASFGGMFAPETSFGRTAGWEFGFDRSGDAGEWGEE